MDDTEVALLELFQRAQALMTDRIDAVAAEQWDVVVLPGWTVADLVAHLVAGQSAVPVLLAGGAPGDVLGRSTAELLGNDPLDAWEIAADAALTSWARPGVLVGTARSPAGAVPETDQLVQLTTELTVHAWDLAVVTGGDTRLDGALVAAALADAERRLGLGGIPGLVAPPRQVSDDADAQTRLLARFGRKV